MVFFWIFWVCCQRWPGMVPRTLRGTLQVQKRWPGALIWAPWSVMFRICGRFFMFCFFAYCMKISKDHPPPELRIFVTSNTIVTNSIVYFYTIQHHLNDHDGVCYKYNNIATRLIVFFCFSFIKCNIIVTNILENL